MSNVKIATPLQNLKYHQGETDHTLGKLIYANKLFYA